MADKVACVTINHGWSDIDITLAAFYKLPVSSITTPIRTEHDWKMLFSFVAGRPGNLSVTPGTSLEKRTSYSMTHVPASWKLLVSWGEQTLLQPFRVCTLSYSFCWWCLYHHSCFKQCLIMHDITHFSDNHDINQ